MKCDSAINCLKCPTDKNYLNANHTACISSCSLDPGTWTDTSSSQNSSLPNYCTKCKAEFPYLRSDLKGCVANCSTEINTY